VGHKLQPNKHFRPHSHPEPGPHGSRENIVMREYSRRSGLSGVGPQ
jgi:hypothetical protein